MRLQRKISAGRINEDILTKKQHIDLILCHIKAIFPGLYLFKISYMIFANFYIHIIY